ncbi:periplasmic nitrate reductase chaperone NapD [Saccharicrinis carchari]|uniref:Chaperone NapD n=1 Tax=Saccharicrinis carchari TaxID=1168039 RepID=A0A521F251_SACCC|nr:chaperone NapD [Saccharicrinis carchari]SMO90288.1 periplasmic nitrate reductase chaperone NapD [Saccharicrinis carchari]
MNISGAIVKVKPGSDTAVLNALKGVEGCEIHLNQSSRIIVTLEAADVSGEIALVKTIEQIRDVVAVEMVYAYSEDELEQERDKLDLADDTPQWLNNESMDAREIKYGGDLKKKI